jgi:hypothetical protein
MENKFLKRILKTLKENYHIVQQFQFWICTQQIENKMAAALV